MDASGAAGALAEFNVRENDEVAVGSFAGSLALLAHHATFQPLFPARIRLRTGTRYELHASSWPPAGRRRTVDDAQCTLHIAPASHVTQVPRAATHRNNTQIIPSRATAVFVVLPRLLHIMALCRAKTKNKFASMRRRSDPHKRMRSSSPPTWIALSDHRIEQAIRRAVKSSQDADQMITSPRQNNLSSRKVTHQF
ncbi:hypothetical protein BST61_g7988 [Cercospora zeina]